MTAVQYSKLCSPGVNSLSVDLFHRVPLKCWVLESVKAVVLVPVQVQVPAAPLLKSPLLDSHAQPVQTPLCAVPALHRTTVVPPWDGSLGDSDLVLGETCQTTASGLCHGNSMRKIQRCRTCFKMAKVTVHTGKQLHDQPNDGANATLSRSAKLPVHHCQARWKNWLPNVAINFLYIQLDVDGHKPTTTVMTVVPHVTKHL